MATPQTDQQKSEYRREIDGLRALAVVCVIINHLNHAVLPGGYLGVDVFFVISGYVITSSLEKTTHSSLSTQLRHFYSRRIKRLMPALLAMIFLTSAVIRLFDPDAKVSTITGITSIFGLSNVFLFTEATNYFGKTVQRNAFGHTWSLGVEEQFYLLYPFLIRWRIPRSIHSVWDDRFRLGALAALSAVSLFLFIGIYRADQPAAYFLTPFRFWELGLGCLLALIAKVAGEKGKGQAIKLNAAIPLLALAPALFLADRYPISCTLTVVFSTVLLIGSTRQGTIVSRILSSRFAGYMGAISYSLYLWHWPVICVSHWTIGIHLWSLPFQIAAIFVLAMASYHLIENPLRRATWIGGRLGPIAAGLPVMAVVAALILLSQRFGIPRFLGDRSAEMALDSAVPGYVAKYSKRKIDDCFAVTVFGTTGGSVRDHLNKCSAETNAGVKLIFVGDSHATDLFPMADEIYRDGVASVLNVSQPTCRVPRLEKESDFCNYPDLLLKVAASDRTRNNILVIRNNYTPRVVDGGMRDFSKRIEQLLARTSSAGLRVIYFAPGPKYYSVGPESLCSVQWYRPEWAMSADCRNGFFEDRGEELARRRDITEYLLGLTRQRNDFFVFDPFIVLCGTSDGDCTPVRDGRLIYRDDSHLTGQGSELLAAPFEAFLRIHQLLSHPVQPQASP
jgi:peptidoglycan/LPS O-acetylase OafA/YrhL